MPDKDKTKDLLRDWYLARLRKSAHDDLSGNISTPAALINLDRGLVQMLANPNSLEKPRLLPVRLRQFETRTKSQITWTVLIAAIAHAVLVLVVR